MDRKKILIVEDETITMALMRKFLRDEGYEVIVSRDGSDAVGQALEEKPDVILLDLGLDPGDPFAGAQFDGFGVMEWMRRMSKEVSIPIIVVTGQTGPSLKERVLQAGAVAFFPKPVNKKEVLKAIRIVLDEV